jgi:eukaryotic translation initiation factor 2C
MVKESQEQPIDRKGFNETGRELEVMVNAFPITKLPDMAVYQYEVSFPVYFA